MRTPLRTIGIACLLTAAVVVAYFGLFFGLMKTGVPVWGDDTIAATCVFRWAEPIISASHYGTMSYHRWSAWNGFFQPAEVIVNRVQGHGNRLQEYQDWWERQGAPVR